MARYTDSVCRLCRRENMRLHLKGERCFTDKCAIERRPYPPGQHGQSRAKFTDFGLQLREKQKAKRIYGILEKQFRSYYKKADRMKGVTGHNLLRLLETRLDNVVYRMGFTSSRSEGRQLVKHGHFMVNGRKVDIPSFICKEGDIVEVREKSRTMKRIEASLDAALRRGLPQWVEADPKAFKGSVKQLPVREDVTMPIQEHLIVELYSK